MLTIRLVAPDGIERVKEVHSVMFVPTNKATDGCDVVNYFFEGDGDLAEAIKVNSGDVYVMNGNGKTVADYHLDKSPLLYGRSIS
jgi:hypothetical protein